MRSLTHILSRANTPADPAETALVPIGGPAHIQNSPPSFMEIAERVGSDNEALRNLLLDIDLQFGAIDNLKGAFAKAVEPLQNLADTLSETKLDNAKLRATLEELRASHDTLGSQHQALDNRATLLAGDNDRLVEGLRASQQARKALEGDKAALSEQIATLCSNLTTVEAELRAKTTEARELAEEKGVLSQRLTASDKRVIELEVAGAVERERALLLESEKASLQTSLDQSLERISQMSRQITNFEKLISDAGARVEELSRSSALLEEERQRLSTACDDANHRREAEVQSLTSELNAARSRCAAAEKQCAELRQTITVQAEERKALETKLLAAASALSKSEDKTASLTTAVEEYESKVAELEQAHSTLLADHRALSKTSDRREAALEEARTKLKSLAHHIELVKADAASNREEAGKLIEQLKTEVERLRMERAVAKGALETARAELGRLQRDMATPQRHSRTDNRDQAAGELDRTG